MIGVLKLQGVARDVTASHFLLMLGYKLFSFYFPLFLLERGLSVPQVGYTFLLIYLPIALFAPFAGMLNHRVNSSLLMAWGIAGYGAYSLGMLFIDSQVLFYSFQALLGISASLFFVSSRSILMGLGEKKPDRSFGWFYSVSFYTDVVGPIAGALLIWKFGFPGVFLASFAIYACNMFFTLARLYRVSQPFKDVEKIRKVLSHYRVAFSMLQKSRSRFLLFLSFAALITGGLYHAFFVLFLRDLGWTQNQILLFGTLSAAIFMPVSLLVISLLGKQKSRTNMLQGLFAYSLATIAFGLLHKGLAFIPALGLFLVKDAGSLMVNSGRSGSVTHSLAKHPEEAGALDTIFSPLGQSFGFLIALVLLQYMDYAALFLAGGTILLACTFFAGLPKGQDLDRVKTQ